jgi:hypothetical protein
VSVTEQIIAAARRAEPSLARVAAGVMERL